MANEDGVNVLHPQCGPWPGGGRGWGELDTISHNYNSGVRVSLELGSEQVVAIILLRQGLSYSADFTALI